MGRGNVCVFGQYESVYYIDNEHFRVEDSEYEFDSDAFENDMEYLGTELARRFDSFVAGSAYEPAENSLFRVTVEDNEWSMAVKLEMIESEYYNATGLHKRHFPTYDKAIRDILLDMYRTIGTYGGSWTSGRLTKGEVA